MIVVVIVLEYFKFLDAQLYHLSSYCAIITDKHSPLPLWRKASAKDREPAEAGQSVDKARSADSIELFVSEGQSYDANKDSGHMWWACVCVCLFLHVIHIEYPNTHSTGKVRTLLGN